MATICPEHANKSLMVAYFPLAVYSNLLMLALTGMLMDISSPQGLTP